MKATIEPTHDRELCQRTYCIFEPGIPIEGNYCFYQYEGNLPMTGGLRCLKCGREKPEREIAA